MDFIILIIVINLNYIKTGISKKNVGTYYMYIYYCLNNMYPFQMPVVRWQYLLQKFTYDFYTKLLT